MPGGRGNKFDAKTYRSLLLGRGCNDGAVNRLQCETLAVSTGELFTFRAANTTCGAI
jgi:hypothetical protein